MSNQKSLDPRSIVELLLLALLWGGSFLAVRIALDEVPVATAVAHRVTWAAILLWGFALATGQTVPRAPGIWGAFLVMGLLNNVIPFSLMAWGQLHIETGLTSILNASTAVFGVAIAAVSFPDERLTSRRVVGVGIGFAGVIIAIGAGNLADLDLRSLAQLAVIGGAISYGLAAAWARARLSDLPPVVAAAGMLTAAALVAVPVACLHDGAPSLALRSETVAAIAYYSLASTALAYLLYYRLIRAAGAGNAALVTLLIPPVAIALGALVRHESLSHSAYLGFAILAFGLATLNGWVPLPRWPAKRARPD